jgi:hypothetical protein
MKLIKMLGLAMVAAIAAMALLGVGTASATTEVCQELKSPCPEAQRLPEGTEIHGVLQSPQAVLKGFLGVETHCQKSEVQGKLGKNPNNPQVTGTIESLTFTECAVTPNPVKECVIKAIQLNYTAHILQGAKAGEGTLSVGPGPGGLQPGAEFVSGCTNGMGINLNGCIYKANEEQTGVAGKNWANLAVVPQEGSPTDHANANQVALKSSFTCGATSPRWEAQYTITHGAKAEPVWVI